MVTLTEIRLKSQEPQARRNELRQLPGIEGLGELSRIEAQLQFIEWMDQNQAVQNLRAEAYEKYLQHDKEFIAEVKKGTNPEAGQRAARLRSLAAERIAVYDKMLDIETEFTRLIKLR